MKNYKYIRDYTVVEYKQLLTKLRMKRTKLAIETQAAYAKAAAEELASKNEKLHKLLARVDKGLEDSAKKLERLDAYILDIQALLHELSLHEVK